MIFVDEKHLSARLACVASLVPAGARVADIGSDHAYLPAALVLDGKIDFAIAGEVVKGPYENAVASLVPAGARVADIGSDHAYLPAALVLDGKIDFAIAGEVVKGPYENAVHEIKDHQLEGRVIPRLADGLAAIEPADKVDTITIAGMGGSLIASILEKDKNKLTGIKRLVLQPNVGLAAIEPADKVDTITIAGMGGSLIASILEKDKNKLTGIKRLVLQPNVGESQLREWLMNNHYQIMNEKIIEEDNHIYEIIVAEPSVVPFRYSKYELDFGPFLLENKGPIFKKKWQEYLQREAHVIDQMQKAQQPPVKKINEINQFLSQVKEAIADDNR